MKSKIVLLFAATLGIGACSPENTGGPGANKQGAKQSPIQTEETFSLTVPLLGTSVKQGETKSASIGISRGKNFQENVAITFSDLPKGLDIDPARPEIKSGETEVKLTLKASETASLGNFTIKVTGHPTKGADALTEMKVTVDKK